MELDKPARAMDAPTSHPHGEVSKTTMGRERPPLHAGQVGRASTLGSKYFYSIYGMYASLFSHFTVAYL